MNEETTNKAIKRVIGRRLEQRLRRNPSDKMSIRNNHSEMMRISFK